MALFQRLAHWVRKGQDSHPDPERTARDFWQPAYRMADYQEARAIARYYALRAHRR
jgi:hypothetical protein